MVKSGKAKTVDLTRILVESCWKLLSSLFHVHFAPLSFYDLLGSPESIPATFPLPQFHIIWVCFGEALHQKLLKSLWVLKQAPWGTELPEVYALASVANWTIGPFAVTQKFIQYLILPVQLVTVSVVSLSSKPLRLPHPNFQKFWS